MGSNDNIADVRARFFHPLMGSRTSSVPKSAPDWSPAQDKALAHAVRRHLFDFAAAANELGGVDADACRQRWAELDLCACVDVAQVAPSEADEMDVSKPSDFNIFHNSLSTQMSTIFAGVRATLPSMGDEDDDGEDDDDDDGVERPPQGAVATAVDVSDADHASAAAMSPAQALTVEEVGTEEEEKAVAERSAMVKADSATRKPKWKGEPRAAFAEAAPTRTDGEAGYGRVAGRGGRGRHAGRGAMFARGAPVTQSGGVKEEAQEEEDDSDDEEDFLMARRKLKDQGGKESTSRPPPRDIVEEASPAQIKAKGVEQRSSKAVTATEPSDPPLHAPESDLAADSKEGEESDADEEDEVQEEADVQAEPPALDPPTQPVLDDRARFQVATHTAPPTSRGKCRIALHSEWVPPSNEADSIARAERVALLRAGGVGSPTGTKPSPDGTAAKGLAVPPSADGAPCDDLCDERIACEPPVEGLPPADVLASVSQFWFLQMKLQPCDLPTLIGDLLDAIPIVSHGGDGVHTDAKQAPSGLCGLQLSVESGCAVVFALVVGNRPSATDSMTQLLRDGLASATAVRTVPSPFTDAPAGGAAPVGADDADGALSADLLSSPGLARTVVCLKEHAIKNDASAARHILGALAPAGLALIGVRLVFLRSQLSFSAQLGLDTPLSIGPTLVLLVEGYEGPEKLQALAGAVDPKLARKTDVGSWRATFGLDRTCNVVGTPRHVKGGHRASCFFFGPRNGTANQCPRVSLALREPRACAVLITKVVRRTRQTHPAASLLSYMQGAGMAVHVAARVHRSELAALGIGDATQQTGQPEDSQRFLFLLSRAGAPMTYATPALLRAEKELPEATALDARVAPISGASAAQLVRGMIGTTKLKNVVGGTGVECTVDLYSYIAFSLKSEVL